MGVKVKICGLTNKRDLDAAVEAGADFFGFVVGVPSSSRNLEVSDARKLVEGAPEGRVCVVVTQFSSPVELNGILEKSGADCLQLHGIPDFSCEPVAAPHRIIGVVDGASTRSIDIALKFKGLFQAVLVDTASTKGLGGTGRVHDWRVSRRIRDLIFPHPMILAGGLTPENVVACIQAVRPFAVDVSSGVELSPGLKSHEKIFEFVRRAKEARLDD